MKRRRKSRKYKFNSNLFLDVAGAMLITDKVPAIIQSFTGFDLTSGQVGRFAGTAIGFGTGYFFDRPDLATASLAVGAVNVGGEYVDELINGVVTPMVSGGANTQVKNTLPPTVSKKTVAFADFQHLNGVNDYTNNPNVRMGYNNYSNFYRN